MSHCRWRRVGAASFREVAYTACVYSTRVSRVATDEKGGGALAPNEFLSASITPQIRNLPCTPGFVDFFHDSRDWRGFIYYPSPPSCMRGETPSTKRHSARGSHHHVDFARDKQWFLPHREKLLFFHRLDHLITLGRA